MKVLDIIQEPLKKKKPAQELTADHIFTDILHNIAAIDFRKEAFPEVEKLYKEHEEASADDKEEIQKKILKFKVQNKHYIVIVIDEVLRISDQKKLNICLHNSSTYLYNGKNWENVEEQKMRSFLGKCAQKMKVPKFEARYFDFADKLHKQFIATAYLPKPKADKEKVLINFQNGTLEITTKGYILREHRPEDFLTYVLPFAYDPKATAPTFENYLNDVMEADKQQVISEYFGYLFLKNGILKLEKVLLLYGTGANGKSVMFEVLNALLGAENVANFGLPSLTNDNGYYRAKIADKLVNYASEISGNLEVSAFKLLASGEPIEARLPYGEPFTLRNYAKLVFNTNELPKTVEHTNAFFRRFIIIHFAKTIPTEKQDKNLHNKIIDSELSGVFNWVLSGLTRLIKQGNFTDSESVSKAVSDYRTESDPVQLFLNEFGYSSGSTPKPLKELYASFRDFCYDNGFKTPSNRTFSDRLKNLGFDMDKRNYGLAIYLKSDKGDGSDA